MQKWILVLALGFVVPVLGVAEVEVEASQAKEIRPATHEMLVLAVREKRVVSFVYNGHARLVEPHAYGVSATGEVVLHAFQIEGESASKPPPGWRTFNVMLIGDLTVTDRKFNEPRPDYAQGEPPLAAIWAALGPNRE